jgi:hypothetical protein
MTAKPWTEARYMRAGSRSLKLRLPSRTVLLLTREASRLGISRGRLVQALVGLLAAARDKAKGAL